MKFSGQYADSLPVDAFVGRQAIFDGKQKVFGFELLFRSCQTNAFDGVDESLATSQVISNSLLTIGLDRLLSGGRAFINFGRDLLIQGFAASLPKDQIVVEVLETVEVDDAVISACQLLKEQDYMIALDDFVNKSSWEPLHKYADIVKIDFRTTPRDEQRSLIRKFSNLGIKMLAEKLETDEEYRWAREAGYSYFQGYFFSRPTVLRAKQVRSSQISTLNLLRELQKAPLDYLVLEKTIKQDVSFSYKLLRYINSGAFPLRYSITSVRQALVILGEDEIRRWATLVVLPGMAQDKPQELVSHALVRARFCELLSQSATSLSNSMEGFLTGMFSLLDAMTDRPLGEILAELNLCEEAKEALLNHSTSSTSLATVLRLVVAYERQDWPTVFHSAAHLAVSPADVAAMFLSSIEWRDHLVSPTNAAAT